jgi:colicin import membrane protein
MSDRTYGILGTIVVHNIILLILLFSLIIIPAKLTPEGGSLIINFGDTGLAGGFDEPAISDVSSSEPAAKAPQQKDQNEGLLTQDFEDAPAVKKSGTTEKTTQKQAVTAPETPVVTTPQVNQRAMYGNQRTSGTVRGASATGTGTSEGIYQGQGNMGSPTGSPESDNYSEGVGGSSIVFSLTGRSPVFLQKPEFRTYTEGAIIVQITVDRNGNVIQAVPGQKGSTIVDDVLYAAVIKAAMESKFNLKNDAPERQVGTITYHFKLE